MAAARDAGAISARIFLPRRIEKVGNETVVPPKTSCVAPGTLATCVHADHGMRVPSPSVSPSLSTTFGQLAARATYTSGTTPRVSTPSVTADDDEADADADLVPLHGSTIADS